MAKEFAAAPRLDHVTDEDLGKLKDFFQRYSKVFIYEEIAQKTHKKHWHAYVLHQDEKEYNAAKERFRKLFSASHKAEQRSYAKDRTGKAGIYASKDGNLVFFKGYTQEEIKEIQSKSYKKEETKQEQRCVWKIVENLFYEQMVKPAEEQGMKILDSELLNFIFDKYSTTRPWNHKQIAELIRYLICKYKDVMFQPEAFLLSNKEEVAQQVWGNCRSIILPKLQPGGKFKTIS